MNHPEKATNEEPSPAHDGDNTNDEMIDLRTKTASECGEDEEVVPVSGSLSTPDGKAIDHKLETRYISKKLAKRLAGISCPIVLRGDNQVVLRIPKKCVEDL